MKHTDWLPGVVLNVVAPVFDGTRTVCNINQTCKHWNMAQLDLCNFNCNTAREGDIPRQQLQRSPPLFPLLLMSTEVCCRALPLSDTKHQPKPGRSKDRRLLTPWTLQESRQTKAAVPTVKHRAQVFQPQTSLTASRHSVTYLLRRAGTCLCSRLCTGFGCWSTLPLPEVSTWDSPIVFEEVFKWTAVDCGSVSLSGSLLLVLCGSARCRGVTVWRQPGEIPKTRACAHKHAHRSESRPELQ